MKNKLKANHYKKAWEIERQKTHTKRQKKSNKKIKIKNLKKTIY